MKLLILSMFIILQFTVTLGCQCTDIRKEKDIYYLRKYEEEEKVCLCCFARGNANIIFRKEDWKVCYVGVYETEKVDDKCYRQENGIFGVYIIDKINKNMTGNWTCGNFLMVGNIVKIEAPSTSTQTSQKEPVTTKTLASLNTPRTTNEGRLITPNPERSTTSSHESGGNMNNILVYLFVFPASVVVLVVIVIVVVIVLWYKKVTHTSHKDGTSCNETAGRPSTSASDVIEIDRSREEVDMSYYSSLNHSSFDGKCVRRLSDVERSIVLSLRQILRGKDQTGSQQPNVVPMSTEAVEISESTPPATLTDTVNEDSLSSSSDDGVGYERVRDVVDTLRSTNKNSHGSSKRQSQSRPTVSVDVYPVSKARYEPTQYPEEEDIDNETGMINDINLSLPPDKSKNDNSDYLTPVLD